MDCKGAGSFGGVEGQSPRGCRAEPCKAKASNKAKSEKINTQHQNKPNKKIENELNIKLPQDYKSFLLQNNGGSPVKDWVFDFTQIIPESGSPFENSSVIQDFSKLSEIPFFYGNLIGEELIPEKYLPIASDPGGNQILLCADENNY